MSEQCRKCDRPVPRERAGGTLCAECADRSVADMQQIFAQSPGRRKCHECGQEHASVRWGVILCEECAAARRGAGE